MPEVYISSKDTPASVDAVGVFFFEKRLKKVLTIGSLYSINKHKLVKQGDHKMKLSEQELYAILKGLNLINNTNETKLSTLDIYKLQMKIEQYAKETA